MAYSTIVTKDEGAVIIVDNIDTKRNKAEHKIIQLNKEAKIYLVSFGKYELDGLVWDSLIKGFQMRVDRKSTRLNSSHVSISYAVFCLKNKREEALRCEV